ncbi:MAG: antirestriction protein ArdA, partial [Gammaproteobacteria bacterium]|nr:antirestriction protein ArdA [Gammaproteobacteria bacterium]
MSNNNLEPKIYVACLAAYNSGHLHGAWIDASQDIDSIYGELKAVLASSPIPNAEEWAIHDYEEFGGIRIDEYDSIETVKALADFIAEHGELGAAAYEHYGTIDDAIKALEENYR